MNYSISHTTSLRVRYGETDQMGYVYYGNYAAYFEVGRVEALRHLGMSYKQLENEGIMLPVHHFEIDYKKPAFYDDLLLIETVISACFGSRLLFDYSIHNEAGEQIASAKTTLVFVSKSTMRPIAPPSHFLQLLLPYAV